ncbi:MAG: hypothetical protein ACE5HP_00700 [Gemmatimonadota bacterium]
MKGVGFRGWVTVLVVGHVALGLLLYEPTLFPGGDNAGYMILGESLRSGAGYRDLYLPGEPLHAKYPPLYPLLLAGAGWIGGVQLFKLLSLAFTAAGVGLAAHLGRRLVSPAAGLATAGALALNPVLLEYSHYVLSEAPFTFLVLLTLLLSTSPRARTRAAGMAAAAAAFLVRTAGLPLLLVVAAGALSRGERRRAISALGLGLGVGGGWAIYQRLAAPGSPGYLGELILRNPYTPALGRVDAGDLVRRTAGNVWSYTSGVLPGSLTGFAPREFGLLLPVGLAVAALALIGWLSRATEEVGEAELFTLLYAGLICVWPEVWTDQRFLLPLLPFILLYAVDGTSRLAARLPGGHAGKRAHRLPAAILAMGLAILALLSVFRLAPDRARCIAAYRGGSPCDPPALASFYGAARWARANTPPETVVANRKPRLFYWYARRRGDVYRYSSEPELVLRSLEEMEADYVAVDAISATTARYLLPAIRAAPGRFEVVYRGGEPETVLLRFRRLPATARTRDGLGTPPAGGDVARVPLRAERDVAGRR